MKTYFLYASLVGILCLAGTCLADGIDCNCDQTGAYVEPATPENARSAELADLLTQGTSPLGNYQLTLVGSALYVQQGGATLVQVSTAGPQCWWGFSPDDHRFLFYDGNMQAVYLYNLQAPHPGDPVVTQAFPLSASPYAGFSPHGRYLFYAGITAGRNVEVRLWDALTGTFVYSDNFTPNTLAYDPDDEVQVAGWGFSPDERDRSFFYPWAQASGSSWRLVNLEGTQRPLSWIAQGSVPLTDGEFRFSPCGDVLAVTIYYGQLDANVSLYGTKTQGNALFSQLVSTALPFHLEAQDGWHVAEEEDGTVHQLIENRASGDCAAGSSLQVTSLSFSPATAITGQPVQGMVVLSQPAPAGGVVVSLASTLPLGISSVMVDQGANRKSFTFVAPQFPSSLQVTQITVIAACQGSSATNTFTITRPDLAWVESVEPSPATVIGGNNLTMTVTLHAAAPPQGAVVRLSSTMPSVAVVPSQLRIPSGRTSGTFSVATLPVQLNPGLIYITATRDSTSKYAELSVTPPPPPDLLSFTLDPAPVISGNLLRGTVTFTGPAPFEGMTLIMDNDQLGADRYFETYRVLPMQSSIPVTMRSPMVSSARTVVYTAHLHATDTIDQSVVIYPASAVGNLSLAQTTVSSCSAGLVWGTVSLDGWLGSSSPSVQVTLTSDHPELVSFERQPADGGGPIDPFLISQLRRDAYFCVRYRPVTDDTVVVITATAGGVSRSCGLLIEPAGLQDFSVFPNVAVAGTHPALFIQMCALVDATIELSSSDPSVASVPPTVKYSTNWWFDNWSVRLHPVDRPTTVTLFASYKDKTRTTQLTVVPPLPPAYSVQDLGTLGGTRSYACGINNLGQVVGNADRGDGLSHAFLSEPNGTPLHDLGTLGGSGSAAYGINDAGRVVGWAQNGAAYHRGFVLDWPGINMRDLGSLGGPNSTAYAVNGSGRVAGSAEWNVFLHSPPLHPFLTDTAGRNMFDLAELNSMESGEACAINDLGQVAGWWQPGDSNTIHAFVTDDQALLLDLGTLGGSHAEAWGFNAPGQVVGSSFTSNGQIHAFVTDPSPTNDPSGGGLHDLGTLGGTDSWGWAVSDQGLVVGGALDTNAIEKAFRCSYGGTPQNLNDLIASSANWTLAEARAINAKGQIAGYGTHHGQTRAFRLTPVSPTSIALSATDVGGGTTVTGTVTLAAPAPMTFDLPLFLQSSPEQYTALAEWDFEAPSTVHFLAGQTSATFQVWTAPTFGYDILTFSVVGADGVHSATLTARAPQVASIAFDQNPVTGLASTGPPHNRPGRHVTATLTLDGDLPLFTRLVVGLSLQQPGNVCQIQPIEVTLPGQDFYTVIDAVMFDENSRVGQAFIWTSQVTDPTDIIVNAVNVYWQNHQGTVDWVTAEIFNAPVTSTVLRVVPPVISRISSRWGRVIPGGQQITINVDLNSPIRTSGSDPIFLQSSSPVAALPTPSLAYVGPGSNQTSFGVLLASVQQATPVTITATLYGQPLSWTSSIVPVGPFDLALDPPQVVGGASPVTGTLRLNSAAEAGGTLVSITSDTPAAVPPDHLLVPEGADSADFLITTPRVTHTSLATIVVSRYDQAATNTLTVLPIGPDAVTFSQTNVIGGKRTAIGTVHLNAPAEAGGALVTLTHDNPVAVMPDQVLVLEGATSADFLIRTLRVDNETPVTVTASRYDLSVTNILNVIPIPTIVIARDNTLEAGSTALEEVNVVVGSNVTLTVIGKHRFNSLAVDGTVTHQQGDTNGLNLSIDELLDVRTGGALDVSGLGFKGGNANHGWNTETRGPDGQATTAGASTWRAGGSYGSLGEFYNGTANRLYGAETAPVDLGSGGSYDGGWNWGGNGGGRVDIEAGQVIINGSIRANGNDGSWGGGGSGGSIWLKTAGDFQGAGVIQAQGGGTYNGGLGGGGRIAVTGYANHAFGGTLGRAGTIFLQKAGTAGQLVLDTTFLDIAAGESKTFDSITTTTNGPCLLTNQGSLVFATDTWTVPSGLTLVQEGAIRGSTRASNYIGSLTVSSNALITHLLGHTNGVQLRVVGALEVQLGGVIDVTGLGFKGGNAFYGWNTETRGPDGQATTAGASTWRAGGSYGSLGEFYNGTANGLYGSEAAPVDLGSGGAYDGGWNWGGNGGGRVDIEAGQVIVNGSILANGKDGSWGGGGSGGSIWLRTAGDFQGTGVIQAQGGGTYNGGAGGGGRIAVTGYANQAFGGTLGRAGTIFLQRAGTAGQLVLDTTILDIAAGESKTFDSITTTANGPCFLTNHGSLVFATDTWSVPSGLTLIQEGAIRGSTRASNYIGSLTVSSNALITHLLGHTNGVQLRVVGTLEVQPGGVIDVTGLGFKGGNSGYGWSSETRGPDGQATTAGAATGRSGGSYGSLGESLEGTANVLYGFETAPVDLGSGGTYNGGWNWGGNGGGRVDIEAGRMIVNGSILANGADGSWGGGGSGGSIWLRIAGDFQGTGVIQAQGGGAYNGGAGGGGRIAVTGYATHAFAGTLGRAGTVFLQRAGTAGQLILDKTILDIAAGESKTFDSITTTANGPCFLTNHGSLIFATDTWTVPSGLTLIQEGFIKGASRPSNYIGSLAVASNALITHMFGHTDGVQLRVDGTLEIQAGGVIDVSGNGLKGGNGYFGWTCETWGTDGQATTAGASIGRSGGSYGSLGELSDGTANVLYGSETAPVALGSGGAYEGGWAWGGNGGGRVDIEAGQVIVNGSILANGTDGSWGGGGSGGSIWLRTAGGFQGTGVIQAQGGGTYNGGVGGGGRIAVTGYATHAFAGTLGRAGTIFLQRAGTAGQLILDKTILDIAAGESKTFDSITTTANGPCFLTNHGSLIFATDTWTVPSGLTLIQEGFIKGASRTSNYIGSLTVAGNALITHMFGHTNGVQLRVVGTLEIQPRGVIDVSGNGLKGGNGYFSWTCETWGADGQATTAGASTGRAGGSYGSLGELSDGTANVLYGAEAAPVALGSGGAYEGGWAWGGNGGGRVDIEAGQVIVNGSILANGTDGSWGGGGSGGSIWLRTAGDFQGVGVIQAQGGGAYNGGPGGGGRIAVTGYATHAFAGTLGRAGTVFLQRAGTAGQLILDKTILEIAAGESKTFDSITTTANGPCFLTNHGSLVFATDTWTVPSGLTLIQEGFIKGASRPSNYIGSLTIASNALVTHMFGHTNGLQLRVVGTLEIQPGGVIDVSSNGLKGGNGYLNWICETWGADGQAATAGASTGESGGSYGGLGTAVNGTPNPLYGLSNAPAELGSGGSYDGGWSWGGNGGGRLDLEAGRLILNGSILANGGYGSWGGGGSGGSIWLRVAGEFLGSGVIQAQGGDTYNGGHGGGGRIAIAAAAVSGFAGTVDAGNGTIWWGTMSPPNPNLIALTIARVGDHGILLSWPSLPAGLRLQQNPGLLSGSWTYITLPIEDTGTNKQILFDGSAGAFFFRLIQP